MFSPPYFALFVLLALGCTGAQALRDGDVPIDDAAVDPDPEFSAAELTALATLAYRGAVTPADPTNAYADDPAAAALGQQLFFDPGFSGRLLDGDNDGSAHALGVRGETGRVSCAGCHIPQDGFVDTRSLGGQISLAASWVLRRTPSLLDVAHRRLMMWD